MTADQVYEVVTKLVGPIDPIGETNADGVRFDNLKVMVDLTEKILDDIRYIKGSQASYEASVKKAGDFAAYALIEFKEELADE